MEENYPSVNFNLLKTAYEETSTSQDRVNIIWKKFIKIIVTLKIPLIL